MSRLGSLRIFDPVLSQAAQGYQQVGMVGQQLYPPVSFPKEAGEIAQFGKESFRLTSNKRAIRTRAKRADWSVDLLKFQMDEYKRESAVDDRERDEATAPVVPDREALQVCQDPVQLEQENLIATDLRTAANWDSDNTETLSGSAQFSDDSSDPNKYIKEKREVVRSKIGMYPNVALVPAAVLSVITENPQVLERLKNTDTKVATAEVLARIWEIEKVIIGAAVYADDDDNFVDVWGLDIVLAYAPPSPGIKIPATGYLIRRTGYPKVTRYRDETIESDMVAYAENYVVKRTSKISGFLIKNAVASS